MKALIFIFTAFFIVSVQFDSYPQRKKKVVDKKPIKETRVEIKQRKNR